MRIGHGDDVVVLSFPIDPASAAESAALPLLTPAEVDVARLALAGLDNSALARARGVSPRTIAVQLSSIYRKLGVGSRAELSALFSHPPARRV